MSEIDAARIRRLPLTAGESRRGLTRREVLQAIATVTGAGVALPFVASGHPIQHHLAEGLTVAEADARANAADWTPEFLDAHQFATLDSAAELIVPGARASRSVQFIDQLLAVSTQDQQRGFLNALGAFEAEARSRFGRPWMQLDDGQRIEILEAAATAESGRPREEPWKPGTPVPPDRPPAQPYRLTARDHLEALKGWIAGAHYSSEIGMKELGFTGNLFFGGFPGCEHPGGHA